MWSLLTRNWNPSSIYEIKSTVNNRLYKRTAKTVKEMDNLSSKNKDILTFRSRRETQKNGVLTTCETPSHSRTDMRSNIFMRKRTSGGVLDG